LSVGPRLRPRERSPASQAHGCARPASEALCKADREVRRAERMDVRARRLRAYIKEIYQGTQRSAPFGRCAVRLDRCCLILWIICEP